MNIQSWMIKSWTTLEWYLPPHAETLPNFKHVGSQLRDDGECTGMRAGDTVWMADHEQQSVGLAWEWVEFSPGMVMLADPNSIITNLQFVDDDQHTVYGLARTVAINRLVHALAWQVPVCGLLRHAVPTDRQNARRVAELAVTASSTTSASAHAARPPSATPADEGTGQPSVLASSLHTPSHGATFSPGSSLLRPSPQTAELHPLHTWRRRVAPDTPRRAGSRASDRDDGCETVAVQDQRRAA